MRRALRIAATAEGASDAVALDLEGRRCRRHVVRTRGGEAVLIDLAEAPSLKAVIDIRAPDLIRIAWHLGNRHLPTEIRESALRIRPDHVIEAMLEGLGASLQRLEAAFEPESGAYGHHHGGQHHHGHG